MTLAWRRDEDGVAVVFTTSSDGRTADVADFWIQPLMDKLGMTRSAAMEWQEQYCQLLVSTFNKTFTQGASA